MKMTPRRRLLAALRGQEVDRVPWSPLLAYWWDSQPQQVQARGEFQFLVDLGADPLLRGSTTAFVCSDLRGANEYPERMHLPIPGCGIRRQTRGDEERVTYETPVGDLTMLSRYTPAGNTRFVVEHPVKAREDYKILAYLVERMIIRPDYEPLQRLSADMGEGGLLVPLISPFLKTPFQALVEHYVGTVQLVYHLADHPEEVEALLEIMSGRALEAVKISSSTA